MSIRTVREGLTLTLIGVLPFHAFLVTLGTKIIKGPGHSPWGVLASWKEGMILLIILLIILEILLPVFKKKALGQGFWNVDLVDLLIVGLLLIGLLHQSILAPTLFLPHKAADPLTAATFLFGFKYTLFGLMLFLIFRRVRWSQQFFITAGAILLGVGGIVTLYGIVTLFVTQEFFSLLGYSDLHSLYLPDSPLAAFQNIDYWGVRRVQSTFSGPNQFGLYLLIPFCIALSIKASDLKDVLSDYLHLSVSQPIAKGIKHSLLLLFLIGILVSFSRSSWIAVAVIFVTYLWVTVDARTRSLWLIRLSGMFVMLLFLALFLFPKILLRPGSTRAHLERPINAMNVIGEYPLGLGLGSAGPAANRVNDACVFLRPQDDPSWAKDIPNLCVFLGDTQVQPVERVCRCPLLTENWYLQVGVELGIAGMLLFLFMIFLILRTLFESYKDEEIPLALPLWFGVLGISVAGLFLHVWEDSAIAYTVWITVAAILSHGSTKRGIVF